MRLKPDQFKVLHDALVDAFTVEELDEFLRREMGEGLERISSKYKAPTTIAFDVISFYERHDRVTELIAKAGVERPNSAALRQSIAPIPVPVRAPEVREKVVQAHLEFANFGQWLGTLGGLARAVGRLELGRDPDSGTGFLVGPDLILTNFHVIESLMRGASPGPSDPVRDRFILDDYLSPEDGQPIDKLRCVPLAAGESWYVQSSPEEKLDYALVRLAERVGDESIQQGDRQVARGYLGPAGPRRPPVDGEPVIVLQYPRSERMKIAVGAIRAIDADRQLIHHTANTDYGSSGAPVLTSDLKLIALHWGHEREDNCASLTSAILTDLGGAIPG